MIKKLSRAAEERLMTTLTKVAEYVSQNDDCDPNEAIAKVASEQGIPHGHVHFIAKAYNTSKSIEQRKNNTEVWDKAASFTLADTSKIINLMYPDKIKSAGDLLTETVVDDEYSRAPGWVNRLRETTKKAEAVTLKFTDKKAEPYARYEEDPYFKARCNIDRADRRVKEARARASKAFYLAASLTNDLKEYFKQADSQHPSDVKANAVIVHGDVVESLFTQLGELDTKIGKKLTKKASLHTPATGYVYDLIADCLEAREAYNLLLDDFETKEAEFKQYKEDTLSPFEPAVSKPAIGSPESVLESGPGVSSFSKVAKAKPPVPSSPPPPKQGPGVMKSFISGTDPKGDGGLTSGIGDIAAKYQDPYNATGFGPAVSSLFKTFGSLAAGPNVSPFGRDLREGGLSAMKDDYKNYLNKKRQVSDEDPRILGLRSNLDYTEQEALLSELLASDDVLSQRDPHEVLNVYSSLRQMAPRATSNKETLRALLRDRIERGGATSIFDLVSLADMEGKLKRLEEYGQPARGEY